MKTKNIILAILLAFMFCPNVEAIKRGYENNDDERENTKRSCLNKSDDIFTNLPIEIRDQICSYDPAFPVSCLKLVRRMVNFVQNHQEYRNEVLIGIENVIVNSLIRFNGQNINLNHNNGRDLVCACAAFRILVGVRRRSPNFCDVQYGLVCNFLTTHEIITHQEIQQGGWNHCEDTVLLNAVIKRNLISLVRAIAAGADVYATISKPGSHYCGWTALHLAVNLNLVGCLQALIAGGVDVNTTINNIGYLNHNWSALRVAAYHGRVSHDNADIIHTLIANGSEGVNAAINNPDSDYHGFTVLHLAVVSNYSEVFYALLLHGADIHATINNQWSLNHGWTVFHLLVTCTKSHKINCDSLNRFISGFCFAIPPDQRAVVFNTTINNPGHKYNGFTPLHLAARLNKCDFIHAFIAAVPPEQRAAFVNATIDNPGHDFHSFTALHVAVFYNHADVAGILIAAGAQIPEDLRPKLQYVRVNVPMNQIVH